MKLSELNRDSLTYNVNQLVTFLRQFKEVPQSTVEFLQQNIGKKFGHIESSDLLKAMNKGVSGEYGEFRVADPQTIFKWLAKHSESLQKSTDYFDTPLAPVTMSVNENWDWNKETNKCYKAWQSGVSSDKFHEGVYMRMQCDGLIPINARNEQGIGKSIERVFDRFNQEGRQFIYFTGVENVG